MIDGRLWRCHDFMNYRLLRRSSLCLLWNFQGKIGSVKESSFRNLRVVHNSSSLFFFY
jgi:hypothetical protein